MALLAEGEPFALVGGFILALVGVGVSVYPALLPERARRPVALSCFIGAAALFLLLLWLLYPPAAIGVVAVLVIVGLSQTVGFIRRRRREDADVHPLTIQGAVHMTSSATITVTGEVVSPWSAGATESEVLHELYPQTRGVLLWCRHASDVPDGPYLCDVSFREETATVRDLHPRQGGRLDCIYPADFENAPYLPLRDGVYRVEWFRDLGVGRELVIELTFERRDGKLLREWER